MLALDSKEWELLSDAYGRAVNIPILLKKLETYPAADNYKAEPYFSLWSSLCHQGDIYTASFAAVPHILTVCKSNPALAHWSLAQLIVCIEIARQFGQAPEMVTALSDSYFAAITELPKIVAEMKRCNPNKEIGPIFKAANSLKNNNPELSEAFLG